MSDYLEQVARLEAVKALEAANATTMRRMKFSGGAPVVDIRVANALDWALEKLAMQRPDDPVRALAMLLRKYEADQRKAAMGVVGKKGEMRLAQ